MSDLSALLGVNFSLFGTNLHAAYEKNGADGDAVLLIPSEQTAENGVHTNPVQSGAVQHDYRVFGGFT